ncbi:formylmethanofuran--tetrahydromethanopterin formyltransferase [candidate division MSBL1 archaeon SCGC-AAA259E19]|uniref:Formylmethanofuran--tetrahydromethanopterin formyltransferase n=1 Tax=candidate division MSBL1 archaeon SCGC-AAA259E19 TaxID=1698264 RepID=A0A133UKB0_9EURY|nr:formylmethanofuran--tetrahydromethanopterin formyltransferase [candidate division MSBL1 archaeon SCGC-AAA259E19]
MQIDGVDIDDTYSEGFDMVAARVLITAKNRDWALKAATEATGFGTSVIECGVEAGVEQLVDSTITPDGRPGVQVIFTAMSEDGFKDELRKRIGQCIMTSPTSSCFNALEEGNEVSLGGDLRYFGDGYQIPKRVESGFSKASRRVWRIPVMEGEFTIDQDFRIDQNSIGGGNFFILGEDEDSVLKAAEKAVDSIKGVKGSITPFPGGIVRSGSKPTSQYSFLRASTNTKRCPTLKSIVETKVPEGVNSVLEIVINGLTKEHIESAIREGVISACAVDGVLEISAGNYGGDLGRHFFHLYEILEE